MDSNTTLVKVKFNPNCLLALYLVIQIQLLLKLNIVAPSIGYKYKGIQIQLLLKLNIKMNGKVFNLEFKYNSC